MRQATWSTPVAPCSSCSSEAPAPRHACSTPRGCRRQGLARKAQLCSATTSPAWMATTGADNRKQRCSSAAELPPPLRRTPEGQEQALIPVAIELKHRQTQAQEAAAGGQLGPGAGVVYSRQQLKGDAQGQVGGWARQRQAGRRPTTPVQGQGSSKQGRSPTHRPLPAPCLTCFPAPRPAPAGAVVAGQGHLPLPGLWLPPAGVPLAALPLRHGALPHRHAPPDQRHAPGAARRRPRAPAAARSITAAAAPPVLNSGSAAAALSAVPR